MQQVSQRMRPQDLISTDRRFSVLIIGALLVVLAAGISTNTFADPDMFHEMSLWREALRLGAIPEVDTFAYTPTRPHVVHHEWLTGAILHTLATTLGGPGILLLRWALNAVIVTGVVLGARRNGATVAVAATFALPIIMMSWIGFTTVRAGLLSMAMLVALLTMLDADRRGSRRWVLAWLPLYVLWLNLHAGFVLGAIFFITHTVEQAVRRRPIGHLLLALAAMAPLTLVNPYGVGYLEYLARAIPLDRHLIGEWEPTWSAWPPLIVVYSLAALAFVYAVVRGGPKRFAGLLLVAAATWEGLHHQRQLAIFAIMWMWYVPGPLAATPVGALMTRFWTRFRSSLAILAGLVGLPCLLLFFEGRPWDLSFAGSPTDEKRYPIGAVDYLEDVGFSGNLLTPFGFGAFVSWRLHPEVLVSIDGRYEVAYADGVLEEHLDFYLAKAGWEELLERYGTDAVLVPCTRPVADPMAELEGWPIVYRDGAFRIHARAGHALPIVDRRGEKLRGRFPNGELW